MLQIERDRLNHTEPGSSNWTCPRLFIGHLYVDGRQISKVDATFRYNPDTFDIELESIIMFNENTGDIDCISAENMKKLGDFVELKLNYIVHCADAEL